MTAKVVRIPRRANPPVSFERCIATVAGGCETILERELRQLGVEVFDRRSGAVSFRGSPDLLVRCNRELRSASRILLSLSRAPVADEQALYTLVSALPWETILPVSATFSVAATSSDRTLRNTRFLAVRVKDAIVDRQRSRGSGRRSSVDRHDPDLRVVVHVERERGAAVAEISLDSSLRALHERGYRTEAGEAPLRETVAAAMLLEAGWRPGDPRPLIDPFGGSGTIAIEAALIRRGIAPGAVEQREYGFERWGWFTPPKSSKQDNDDSPTGMSTEATRPQIICSDIDPALVSVAQRNARRAGVESDIEFVVSDVRDLVSALRSAGYGEFFDADRSGTGGLLVSNPPYGERLSGHGIVDLYADLGQLLKRDFGGWNAWLLTQNAVDAPHVGLRADHRVAMYNGSIACRLSSYRLRAFASESGT